MTTDPIVTSCQRIAFLGASGTGKSTLALWLQEALGIELNPVGSRSTAKAMGFEHPYDVDRASGAMYEHHRLNDASPTDAAREALRVGVFHTEIAGPNKSVRPAFQTRLQQGKIDWETGHDRFVSDRTTLDDLCYAYRHCPDVVDEAFYERALAHMNRYDIVIYCPLAAFQNLDNAPETLRTSNPTYHRMYDATVYGLLTQAWNFRGKTGGTWSMLRLDESTLEARKSRITQRLTTNHPA